MSRYFYYFTLINMVTTMTASMPKILIMERKEGALLSILLAIAGGVLFCYICGRFFLKYPGKDFPELLNEALPKMAASVFLLLLGVVWYVAGLLSLVTYSFYIKRFMSPNTNLFYIVTLIVAIIYYGALMKTKSVLYTLEVISLVTIPFILLLIIKAFNAPEFIWDFVKESMMYYGHVPSYSSFSASIFIFWGPLNLMIFNRVLKKKQSMNWKSLLFLGAAGAGALFSSLFLSLGIQGFENAEIIVYPTMTTADSLRFQYGLVERVLYVGVLLTLTVSFASILTHWHVAIEMMKKVITLQKWSWKGHNLIPHLLMIIFWFTSLKIVTYLNEYQLLEYTDYFYDIFPFLVSILLLLFWRIRRKVKA
jgi:hypothetical protein